MKKRKYEMPKFLQNFEITQEVYEKWLDRKAKSQFKRDKSYYEKDIFKKIKQEYKEKIYKAVDNSCGKDYYTGEKLDWKNISNYGKKNYKKIPNLPTADHINRHNFNNEVEFVICSWKVNDMKNDLSYDEFIELCKKVLEYKDSQNE